MAEFPSLPLFTDALIADTNHLSHEEFGLYMRVLILMWRTPGCRIPNDKNWIEKRLAYAAAGPLFSNYNKIEETLSEFCQCDGNWWTQKRLSKEYEYVKNQRVSQSEKAKKRWNSENDEKTPPKKSVSRKPLKNNKSKGNSAYAPHSTPPKDLKSPLPPSRKPRGRLDPPDEDLDFENLEGGGFDILHHLDDQGLADAKAAAPGWDVYFHARTYNQVVNSGRFEVPRNPAKAFAAWCKSYRKGQSP